MLTIEQAKVENFAFKKGDRVKITWHGGFIEFGYIHELHTGIQWEHEVVYAIMVMRDGHEKPCVVGFDCIKKAEPKNQ